MSLKYVIIGVEGDVTEPAGIEGALSALRQQSPHGYAHLEIVPLSLGGNHGHGDVLLKRYLTAVEQYINNPDNCFEPGDEIIKVIACDYDDMDKHGVDESKFRHDLETLNITPIISKPKFELFVAGLFWDEEILLRKLQQGSSVEGLVSEGVRKYNESCELDFMKIPAYSKRRYDARNWFSHVFNIDPEFLRKALSMEIADTNSTFYTDVPNLMKMIANYFEKQQ